MSMARVKAATDVARSFFADQGFEEFASFIVLGSGFKGFLSRFSAYASMDLSSLPEACIPSVAGHGTSLIAGTLDDHPVLVQTGRVHLYEGYSPEQVVFTIRVAHALGIKNLLLTNASGGLSDKLKVGEALMISDQLNLTGHNPLRGTDPEFGEIFVDMSKAFCPQWRKSACSKIGLAEGVYAGVLGPTYESPAEARYYKSTGADCIGMSTVLETIAARQLGMRVAGISLVTNVAGGDESGVDHQEVLQQGEERKEELTELVAKVADIGHRLGD